MVAVDGTISIVAEETLRLKWQRLVEQVLRSTNSIDTRALYPATVISSDGNRASVKPDDERLGLQLSNKPVRRPDGYTAVPKPGMRCLIGWDGYREDGCFILLGFDGNGSVDSITLDAPIVTATHDLASQHELGISSTLLALGQLPAVTSVAISGDDASFDLVFTVANGQLVAAGGVIATVTLGRAFSSAPRAVASAKSGNWGASAACFQVDSIGNQQLQISWVGNASLVGPKSGLAVTVFVRGSV